MLTLGVCVAMLAFASACRQPSGSSPGAESTAMPSESEQLMGDSARQAGVRPDTLTISSDSLQANLEREVESYTSRADSTVVAEAFMAVAETQRALQALDRSDKEAAIAALERATGKLEILLARRPELGLVPLDARVSIVDLQSDIETVERIIEEAEELMDDGKVQAARRLLRDLESELKVTTINLPLSTYPDAIKEAVRKLEEADTTAARRLLETALTTLVVEEESIPLPLINAEAMVEGAQQLVAENQLDMAISMLADARYQLRLAEALGYGEHDEEFEAIREDIRTIEKQIEDKEDKEDTGKPFEDLKRRLSDFKQRITS